MTQRISKVVHKNRLTIIREMWRRAERYDDVISLGIGEPDFTTPAEICRAALADAEAGHTHYVPERGSPELLAALSRHLAERHGCDVPTSRIAVTTGAMGALFCAFRTLLEPGDEVLIQEPFFPPYRQHVTYSGGVAVPLATRFENAFILQPEDLAAAITDRTRVLLMNSPNNPTGAVIPGEVLDELARVAVANDLFVISDEVYDRILFRGRHESISTRPGMADRTLVVNSFSKAFAMTGWRVGYAVGPEWLMSEIGKVLVTTTACASSIGQRAALAALAADQGQFEKMAATFKLRCELAYERLSAMPGLKVHPPAGTFYLLPDIGAITDDTEQFAFDLLDAEQVVVVPGGDFGPSAQSCIRVACTIDEERLAEAMDRIERFLR